MIVLEQISEVKHYVLLQKQNNKTIGFVPTMGALHQGHISLIEISKKNCDITICSIFVNPTQFNNTNDLSRYPRTPDNDIKLLKNGGCDVLYMPNASDIYPEKDNRQFNFGYLDTILEGALRPGHYNGVGQVVSILLQGIAPHKAFFGSKDYQQVMVVKKLVAQLQLPVKVVSCPILREIDGLAMSSRNVLLSATDRTIAALVPNMMQQANVICKTKSIADAKLFIKDVVSKIPLMKLDYFEVCNHKTLEPLHELIPNEKAISLIAVFVGTVRLIDNWEIN